MKTRIVLMSGIAGLLFAACVPSVNPFYTDKDIAFEPRLVGSWGSTDEDDGAECWEFVEAEPGRDYRLTVTDDDGKQGRFEATLFKLRDQRFLDLIPDRCEYATNQAEMVAVAMFPGHLVLHIARLEPTLELAFMDAEWLDEFLKENPTAIAHRREGSDERILFTATTRDLQRFLLKHVEGGQLFSDYGELQRESAGKPPAANP